DGQLLGRDARREAQGPGGRGVVAAGDRGRVGGGEADRGRERGGAGQGDGEDGVGGAGIALGDRDVVDREGRRRVVVGDGAERQATVDRRIGGAVQLDEEVLVRLEDRVALHRDRELLGGDAGREGQRAGPSRVVAGGHGAAVGRREVGGDDLAGR